MLELVKKNIHMNRWKSNVSTQITLDDDFIVPDTMDDMEQIILENGDIQVESAKNQGEKVVVKGKLEFHVLYRKAEGGLQTLGGSIPFEETINVPGLEDKDFVGAGWKLDDLNAGIINSRKLSVKAIVTLEAKVETLLDVEASVDVNVREDAGFGQTQLETLKRNVDVAVISLRKKDTYRLKEEITVSGNKPDIDRILWSEMKLMGVSTRPLDGKVRIEGELQVFVIYESEGDHTPVQWLEESLPFSGEVELLDAVEEMIPFITVRLLHKDIDAKPDFDGEMRELEIDAVIELDMKLYEEEPIELLSDLYSTNRELTLQTGEACFDRMIAKNTGKCKVNEKLKLHEADRILQICHSGGTVKIDEVTPGDDGLHIEGVLEICLLYLTDEDNEPIRSGTEVIPFHYVAEAPGIREDSVWQLSSGLEQLTAVMVGGDTVEVKAVLSLDLLALQPVCETVIDRVEEGPLDVKKLQAMPGIVGYIVQPGDDLWGIAKKFHTTGDTIISTNGMNGNRIAPGDRLILVKEIRNG